MSSVLGTRITKNMINRSGYIPLETITDLGGFLGLMDDDFMYYTFKDCLKVDSTDFHKWVCYWEGYPFAIECDIKADKLITGFTKVAILSKRVVPVSEIGEYPGKQNTCFGHIFDGKFNTDKGIKEYVNQQLLNVGSVQKPIPSKSTSKKVTLSNSDIKNLKSEMEKNWGCTLKY